MNLKPKLIGAGIFAVIILSIISMSFGINNNGYRTVVQTPNGYTFVKFNPGLYLTWFGTATEYPDYVTFDFDKTRGGEDSRSISQSGIVVRYQEGGTGTVFGQARFKLPDDEVSMLSLHKAYHSTEGVSFKLIKPSTEETTVLTANLMTSDESYMEKRTSFSQWVRDQLGKGKYRTTLQTKETKEEGTDKTVYKSVPVIANDKDGLPIHESSDLKTYGVTIATLQLTDWDYEQKTLEQIQKRREANMAIITAKADADRAKQDAITAEQNGLKNVTVAKYEKEVEKQKAVVDAEREKEVAEIAAKQQVSVAEQKKLEQEQNKLAAAQYKEAETLRGEGDAAYKRAVIEADGALAQKLATYEKVQAKYAEEFGKQKWVPNIQMGGSASTGGANEAANMINLLTAKTAKDLDLNLNMDAPAPAKK